MSDLQKRLLQVMFDRVNAYRDGIENHKLDCVRFSPFKHMEYYDKKIWGMYKC